MPHKTQLLMQVLLALLCKMGALKSNKPKSLRAELAAQEGATRPAVQPAYVSAYKRSISPKTPQMTIPYTSNNIALHIDDKLSYE